MNKREYMGGTMINRRIAELLLLVALLGGAVACVPVVGGPNDQEKTPMSYPLPGGSTETETNNPPALSAEAPITLISPMIPTETLTTVPTATEIPTATATLEVEKYPIDMEKLSTPPQNYDELVAHPEKFVQAPNPIENIGEFKKWFNEKLFKEALGGVYDKIGPVNYNVDIIGIGQDRVMISNKSEKPNESMPKFFYFKDKDKFYPTYVITTNLIDYSSRATFALIVTDELYPPNYDRMVSIAKGERGLELMQLMTYKNPNLSESETKLYDYGFGSYFSTINTIGNDIFIGFGTITFFGDKKW
jgi:hypothetical protein